MYKITEELATHGLGEINYPMDKMELLLQKHEQELEGGFHICDVRYLLDEPQPLQEYIYAIADACVLLNIHKKIVICCGAGQSRSNAIAIGVLMEKFKMDFYDAYNLVREKVPICMIEPCHLNALKRIYKVGLP